MPVSALSGITVTCFKVNGDGTFTNVGSDTTDEEGFYFIGDLDTGEYTLKFSDNERNGFYKTIYLGGKYSLDEASTFSVNGEGVQDAHADITVPTACYVNGTVSGLEE